MNKLKVLFLITDIGKGGAERFLIDLCSVLHKRDDVEFIIGTLYPSNEYPDLTKDFKIIDLEYNTFSLFKKTNQKQFRNLLDTFKPDIIHTHRYLAEFLSGQAVNPNIGYVCHGHDNMIQLDNLHPDSLWDKEKIFNWLEKRFLLQSKYNKVKTHFIANSSHTEAYYQKVLRNIPNICIHRIDYGFDHAKFHQLPNPCKSVDGKLRILNVGSFQNKKNQKFIIPIARELKVRNIDFEINLIGQGVNHDEVNQLVKENGLEKEVVLRGLQDKVEDWYKASDIYLHTAYYEPFGLVFLEAMAAGLPIISLNGSGNTDIIRDGWNGFLFQEEKPSLFADAIELLRNDETLAMRLASNGNEFAKRYDMQQKADEYLTLYKSIIPR